MKKIKNIKQLRKEKKLLQQREKELMWQIKSGWQHLQLDLHPQNIIKEHGRKCGEENILKSTLSFGASLLAKNLAKKAEEKLEKLFD